MKKPDSDRREFLRKSITGAASAWAVTRAARSAAQAANEA